MVEKEREAKMVEVSTQDLQALIASIRRMQQGDHAHRCSVSTNEPLLVELRDTINGFGADFEERLGEFHASSMELALGLSECFEVLSAVRAGRLSARVSDAILRSEDPALAAFGKTLNETVADLEQEYGEVDRYHESSMELAMGLSECFEVLSAAQHGKLAARVTEATLGSSDSMVASLGRALNDTMAELEKQLVEVERYHESSMELAMGLSECFAVLAEARGGNLAARVTAETLSSSEVLVVKLGEGLNDTMAELHNQVELIKGQQLAIQELSTPILNLWDDVLALPIIGVVDTKRTTEIMEKLLDNIVSQQSRFVIMDITGVDVVDTKTADYFIRIIKASELLGAKCVLTGIRPAVAQTLVEIGVDLSSISTLRTLRDGLKTCMRMMRSDDKTPGRTVDNA